MDNQIALALINNLPAVIAAIASLITAGTTAYLIISQRGHKDLLERIVERQQDVQTDHDHNL